MRTDPDPNCSEFRLLVDYLDYQRETALSKTEGLTHVQLVSKHPPSELTLAGLLYHLALVEENWMEVRFSGLPEREPWASVDWDADPNWEFRTAESMEPEQLRARYRRACERSHHLPLPEAVNAITADVRPAEEPADDDLLLLAVEVRE